MKEFSKAELNKIFESIYDEYDDSEKDEGFKIDDSWEKEKLLKANNVLTFRRDNDGLDEDDSNWWRIREAIASGFDTDSAVAALVTYSDDEKKKSIFITKPGEQVSLDSIQHFAGQDDIGCLAYKLKTKELMIELK